jgi:hypothetical protein
LEKEILHRCKKKKKQKDKLNEDESNGKSRFHACLKICTHLKKVRMCSVGAISLQGILWTLALGVLILVYWTRPL